jgi:hypothetical protein
MVSEEFHLVNLNYDNSKFTHEIMKDISRAKRRLKCVVFNNFILAIQNIGIPIAEDLNYWTSNLKETSVTADMINKN